MANRNLITREMDNEEMVNQFPEVVAPLADKGVFCVVCGEPVWGTLEALARKKGFSEEEIDHLVRDLNTMITNNQHTA